MGSVLTCVLTRFDALGQDNTNTAAHTQFARQFMADPNAATSQCDVLVYTYAMQAGVSLEAHFKVLFCFLYRWVGTWGDAFQSAERLRQRPDLRPDLHKTVFMYIQPGMCTGWTEPWSIRSAAPC